MEIIYLFVLLVISFICYMFVRSMRFYSSIMTDFVDAVLKLVFMASIILSLVFIFILILF